MIAAPVQGRLWVTGVEVDESDDVAGTVGSVLLIAALAGIVLATLSWFWLGRRSHLDRQPHGPAY